MTTLEPDTSSHATPRAPTGALGSSATPPSPPLDLGAALWRSLPGRLVLLSSGLLLLLLAAGLALDLPYLLDVVRRIAWISWLVGVGWLLGATAIRNRHVILWRVRRKLLLSYVFFGVVPVVLVLAFGLAAAVLLYVTVAKYVFLESYVDSTRVVRDIAATSAMEIGRTPPLTAAGLERRYDSLRDRYPGLSLALVPIPVGRSGAARPVLSAGPWRHTPLPASLPDWLVSQDGFSGSVVVQPGRNTGQQLVIRAAVPTADRSWMALVDLPVDDRFGAGLRDETGIAMGTFAVTGCGGDGAAPAGPDGNEWTLFRETVADVDCTAWPDGSRGSVSMTLVAPVRDLYASLATFNLSPSVTSLANWASVLPQLLWLLGVLFLIVQGSAVVMGVLLARSITSAVHELFEGTERVRQGDFAHRIRIESNDQLGELAGSFNRMSSSIEHLLHVQREKQRLDDELRIAREIQRSLLPVHPPALAGLDIADLCEPAREVGGDYYDFFDLGPRQLGVMIADVSGKGTSAALYMAELKGIMLALSRADRSPCSVLIEVNRLLAAHLDNRSFITMTYAIVDLDRHRVTVARAGHTPMLVVSAERSRLVVPEGMVLGLRLPGSESLFEQILQEQELSLAPGDVVVLYTDGVTETMDADGEMFGDEGLARVVAGHRELGAAGIRERVLRETLAFAGGAEAHDDMTMVVLKFTDGRKDQA